MSLFGKVLAVLNLLGATALVYFAMVDYGARHKWSYNVSFYDWMINGLPVDDVEPDSRGQPLADQLADSVRDHLFQQVGPAVSTQMKEVEALKQKVDAKLGPLAADPRQHTHALAGILIHFAEGILERDQYLAILANLETPAARAALEKRYVDALREALRPDASGKDRLFEQAFRLAVRTQGGVPTEGITTLLVEQIPPPRTAEVVKARGYNVALELNKALETQRNQMVARLERLFAEAQLTATPERKDQSLLAKKAAIARLMFGLSLWQASETLAANPAARAAENLTAAPGSPDWYRALVNTAEQRKLLRRVYVVCGLKVGLNAITTRAASLRLQTSQVDAVATEERLQFFADDAALLEESRAVAARVFEETAQITENEKKLADQTAVVAVRTKEVADRQQELKESIAATDVAIRRLRDLTERLRQARIESRDLLDTLLDRERQIQDLNRQVIAAEKKNKAR